MKKTYEVTGHYPAFRPMPIGSTVELLEEVARYHVLDGVLKAVDDEPTAGKRKGGER